MNIRENNSRKIRELIVLGILGFTVFFALITCPFEDLTSFNPVEWVADSINGFLNMLEDLFFGWIK